VLGQSLKLVRIYHNFSQSDACTRLDISRSYLSELESGKKKPSLEVLEKYSAVFNIPVSSILILSEHSQISSEKKSYVAKKMRRMLEWIDDTLTVS
jgi:transcriptional regulator with XRE-family HTH domain